MFFLLKQSVDSTPLSLFKNSGIRPCTVTSELSVLDRYRQKGRPIVVWLWDLVPRLKKLPFFFLLRIVITVQPPAPLSALEEVPSSDNSPLSSLDAYPVMRAEPSPFSSRPVMFETEEVSSNSSVCTFLVLTVYK